MSLLGADNWFCSIGKSLELVSPGQNTAAWRLDKALGGMMPLFLSILLDNDQHLLIVQA